MTNRNGTTITWNSDNMPTTITQNGSNSSQFAYAPDKHRYYQTALIAGVSETTVYVGAYEAVTTGGITKYRHHLMADGREVAEVDLWTTGSTTTENLNYVFSDHLGSVDVVQTTSASGTVLSTTSMSFGAWGNRRLPGTWLPPVGATETQADHNANRYGFTHQEMLDNVALIHMNGRVYDPNLGRFLSVDPVFEFPTNTQSLNPYSYVLNNPLSLTDPTGYAAACKDDGTTTSCTGNIIPTGSHIAQSVTATAPDKGGPISFSGPLAGPGGHSLMLGSTMLTASLTMRGNGAQTSQGAAGAQNKPTGTTDIGSVRDIGISSQSTGPQLTMDQEVKLLKKTYDDISYEISTYRKLHPERTDVTKQALSRIKLIIIRGFAKNQNADSCKTGCTEGEWTYQHPEQITIYAGAAIALGATSEGGLNGTIQLLGHEFDHSTTTNQAIFSSWEKARPWMTRDLLKYEESTPQIHDALPWEMDANQFGRDMVGAYMINPPPN